MTANEMLEVATRSLVLLMYVTAIVTAIVAIHAAKVWSKRRSGIAIMIASAVWILFYLFAIEQGLHDAGILALWSRVAHYVNSAALIAIAGNIISATKVEDTGPHYYLSFTSEEHVTTGNALIGEPE